MLSSRRGGTNAYILLGCTNHVLFPPHPCLMPPNWCLHTTACADHLVIRRWEICHDTCKAVPGPHTVIRGSVLPGFEGSGPLRASNIKFE